MAQKNAKNAAKNVSKSDLKDTKQKKLIAHLKKKENWMKWGLIAAGIIILLLLLFIGYATDWMMGLKKASAPLSTDSSKTSTGAGTTTPTTSTPSAGGSSGGGGGGTPTNTGSGGGGQSSTNTNTTTTDRTTTNNTTTNNNTTSTSKSAIDTLLSETGAGDNINTIIQRANDLGISVSCTDQILIKECTFTAAGQTFTTKSLTGNDIITSVLGL